jgi:hypothetical protein
MRAVPEKKKKKILATKPIDETVATLDSVTSLCPVLRYFSP